jgi:hypothetical protein
VTVIRCLCPYCGELELSAKDMHLVTYDRVDRDYYEFICPECEQLVRKSADTYVVGALRSGSVPETRIRLPIEALDEKRAEQVPLTYDDLLDFVLGLGETDELASAQ